MIHNIDDMQIMDYQTPIDLRISKHSDTTCYPIMSSIHQSLNERFISRMQPNYEEINAPTTKLVNDRTNLITNSFESRINKPSVSPDSSLRGCDECKQTPQNEEMKQFRMEVVKRRCSESSISSDHSNNYENSKIAEIEIMTDIPKKRNKLNDIPRIVSSDSGLSSNEIEDEELLKNEQGFSKPSRVDMSPIYVPSSETGNCDSSTKGRSTRPFKAITSTMIIDPLPYNGPLGDFETFRKNILSRVNSSNKSTNQNMRRSGNTTNTHITDPAYWEKRRRNNEAAKRSRDARRRKEDEVAIRCAYLEQERILMLQENKLLREALKKYQEFHSH